MDPASLPFRNTNAMHGVQQDWHMQIDDIQEAENEEPHTIVNIMTEWAREAWAEVHGYDKILIIYRD